MVRPTPLVLLLLWVVAALLEDEARAQTTTKTTWTSTTRTRTTTSPGQWDTYVGTGSYMTKIVDVGAVPGQCRWVAECCQDEFTLCYDGNSTPSTPNVTIKRTDSEGVGVGTFTAINGWGQTLYLSCLPEGERYADQRQASAPALFQLKVDYVQDIGPQALVKYRLGAGMGDCTCASPRIEYKRQPCREGWRYFDDACYGVFEDVQSWETAEYTCNGFGGHLTSLNGTAELTFVASLANGTKWIGHNCSSANSSSACTSTDFYWVDGNATTYLATVISGLGVDTSSGYIDGTGTVSATASSNSMGYICKVLAWIPWPLEWEAVAGGTCDDDTRRDCYFTGLVPDATYNVRMQTKCFDEELNSPYRAADPPTIAAYPHCKFTDTTGEDYTYECADGSKCTSGPCIPHQYNLTQEVLESLCSHDMPTANDKSPTAVSCDRRYTEDLRIAIAQGLFGQNDDDRRNCQQKCVYDKVNPWRVSFEWNATGYCWARGTINDAVGWVCMKQIWQKWQRLYAQARVSKLCKPIGWTCCDDSRGGKVRCPPSLPVMCDDGSCQTGSYTCDFLGLGGARICSSAWVPPKAPVILKYEAFGQAGLSVTWVPGNYVSGVDSPCTLNFQRWFVQIVKDGVDRTNFSAWGGGGGTIIYTFIPQCASLSYGQWTCQIDGLYGETNYWLRMRQECDMYSLSSEFTESWYYVRTNPGPPPPPPPTTTTTTTSTTTVTTTPGSTTSTSTTITTTSTWFWDVVVGASSTASKTVNLGQIPYKCELVRPCCLDEWSICYDVADRRLVTLTRTDSPADPDVALNGWDYVLGWGQEVSLHCDPTWSQAFLPLVPKKPALSPDRLAVTVLQAGIFAKFRYALGTNTSYAIGDCECAVPSVEYRQAACEPGWAHMNDGCFKAFDVNATWVEAEADCIAHGGRLPSLRDNDEKWLMLDMTSGFDVWVGGLCQTSSAFDDTCTSTSSFVWSDGSDTTFLRSTPTGVSGGLLLLGHGPVACSTSASSLTVVSASGRKLFSSSGVLGATSSLSASSYWTVVNVWNGKIALYDAGGRRLFYAPNGTLGTELASLPRSEWQMIDAGGGYWSLSSTFNNDSRLEDNSGTLRLARPANTAAQRWRIRFANGQEVCKYTHIPYATHRVVLSENCPNATRCSGYSKILLREPDLGQERGYLCRKRAEYRDDAMLPWNFAPDCVDPARRQCSLPALSMARDANYEVRTQVTCLDRATNSGYTYSDDPVLTLPNCKFLTPTSHVNNSQCADGTFCDASANSSCCGGSRGGIIRCPSSRPIMCKDQNCSGGTEPCCAANSTACSVYGGALECTNKFAPAKAPIVSSFVSYDSDSLTVNFTKGLYMSGVFSPCNGAFKDWKVEYKRVSPPGVWTVASDCLGLAVDATTCTVTGLVKMAPYGLRIAQTCLNPKLDSSATLVPYSVTTRPLPAGRPVWLRTSSVTDTSVKINWVAAAQNDCTFSYWEVSLRLLPRENITRADNGNFEAEQLGGTWFVSCMVATRSDQQCRVGPPYGPALLTYRDYEVRVRERCSDARADSAFMVQNSRTITVGDRVKVMHHRATPLPIPAGGHKILQPKSGADTGFREVAIELTGTVVFGPRADRTYSIRRLDGSTAWYEEEFLERAFRTTPAAATVPVSALAYDELQYSFGVDFTAGDTKACILMDWQIQVTASGTAWKDWTTPVNRAYACKVNVSTSTYCVIRTPLGSSLVYDVRIREVCTDPTWNSPWAYFPALAKTVDAIRAISVSNIVISPVWPNMMTINWDAGYDDNDCSSDGSDFKEWLVELRPNGSSNASAWVRQPECARLPREPTVLCNVLGEAYNCTESEVRSGRCAPMGFYTAYELRLREHCTDPGADSIPVTTSGLTRQLMTALAPWGVRFTLANPYVPPYIMTVVWSDSFSYDCTLKTWGVHMQEYPSVPQPSYTSITSCHFPGVYYATQERPYDINYCYIAGNKEGLKTNTTYTLRIWEECDQTAVTLGANGVFTDGARLEQIFQTAAAPSRPPDSVELYGVTGDSVFASFEANDIGDCPTPYPYVEVWPEWQWFNGSGGGWGSSNLSEPWPLPDPAVTFSPHGSLSGFVKIVGLSSDTLWHVQIRISCRPPWESLTGNYTNAQKTNASAITRPGCAAAVVPCTSDKWIEKAPSIDYVSSFDPGELTVHFSNLDYLSGDKSPCVFKEWRVEIAYARDCNKSDWWTPAVCSGWRYLPNCSFTEKGTWRGHDCRVQGLEFLMEYMARVKAVCTDPALDSMFNVTKNYTMTQGWYAGIPENVTADITSATTLDLAWDAGDPGLCAFTKWGVYVRKEEAGIRSGPWSIPTGCGTMTNRSNTQCTITGLDRGQQVSLQILEECTDPRANSQAAETPIVRWDQAGQWALYVGSYTPGIRTSLNVLDQAAICVVEEELPLEGDEFSLCLVSDSMVPYKATVTRADVLFGWGQQLWLNCSSGALASMYGMLAPASAPAALQLLAVNSTVALVTYILLDPIGHCDCAEPHLQIRVLGAETWYDEAGLGGECADMSLRGCTLTGLLPDTIYEGRVQIKCRTPSLSSQWKSAAPWLRMQPLCVWETKDTDNGLFECRDGSFCQDNATQVGGACCSNGREGVMRCPVGQRMCANGCTTDSNCFNYTLHGGVRRCTDEQLPARIPTIKNLTTETPWSLTLTWSGDAYVSGVHSPCLFLRWDIWLADADTGVWVPACPEQQHDERALSCTVAGLQTNHSYLMRVAERCKRYFYSSSATDSLYTSASVFTKPLPTLSPTNISVVNFSASTFELAWNAADSNGDCNFSQWSVEHRLEGTSTWLALPSCSAGSSRSIPRCTVSIPNGTFTEFRVTEACTDPRANAAALTPMFRWRAAGQWDVVVPPSNMTSVEVDVVSKPHFCHAATYVNESRALNGLELSLSPYASTTRLQLLRTDRFGGWDSRILTTCRDTDPGPRSDAAFKPLLAMATPVEVVRGPDGRSTAILKYLAGSGLGQVCQFARLRILLAAVAPLNGSYIEVCSYPSTWAERQCLVPNLLIDSNYKAKVELTCAGAVPKFAQSSETPFVTRAGCTWSSSSGLQDTFLCKDGFPCSLNGTDGTCCNSRGGRAQCMANLPVMCRNATACANGTDYCCAASIEACAAFGGHRLCRDAEVSAKQPLILSYSSPAGATLDIKWLAQEWQSGTSNCVFLKWTVELARVNGTQPPVFSFLRACQWFPRMNPATCTVDFFTAGLREMTEYYLRVAEVCTEERATSLYTYWPVAVRTLPYPALAPQNALLNKMAPTMNSRYTADTSWTRGLGENCTFAQWEVQTRQMPQEGNLTKPYSAGENWTTGCNVTNRNWTNCTVSGLVTNYLYGVRVREACNDTNANSAWSTIGYANVPVSRAEGPAALRAPADGLWTSTAGMRYRIAGGEMLNVSSNSSISLQTFAAGRLAAGARTGQVSGNTLTWSDGDVWGRQMSLYNFEVQWDAGDPWACLLARWEVQAKETGGTNWTSTPAYSCNSTLLAVRTCSVITNVSNKTYDVRVRQACTNASLTSNWTDWAGSSGAFSYTRLPVVAGSVTGIAVTFPTPFVLNVSWTAGAPQECAFAAWRVEVRPECGAGCSPAQTQWQAVEGCGSARRAASTCQVSTRGLTLSSSFAYTVRVTEACADPNANSVPTEKVQAFRLAAAPPPPTGIVTLGADSAGRWLTLSWAKGSSAGSCSTPGYLTWVVEWAPTASASPNATAGKKDCAAPCKIDGLQPNTPYNFYVEEACTSPVTQGSRAASPVVIWTMPGQWLINVGAYTNFTSKLVVVNVREQPMTCIVEKECCTDEWSICINGSNITVTRVDSPGGWGQKVNLRCVAASLSSVVQLNSTPPQAPTFMRLMNAYTDAMTVEFSNRLSGSTQGCHCAFMQVEHTRVVADGSYSGWQTTGNCTGTLGTMRSCLLAGLSPSTEYLARAQIICQDGKKSAWKIADTSTWTMSPVAAVGGALAGQVDTSRRLSSAATFSLAALVDFVRQAVVDVANVPRSAVRATATSLGADRVRIDYEVAVAEVENGTSQQQAMMLASGVVSLLSKPDASGIDNPDGTKLSVRLTQLLGGYSPVFIEVPAQMQLRTAAYPTCGSTPNVSGAAPSWTNRTCSGRTWSDPVCEVPCAYGYQAEGAGFRCSLMGEWEDEPPRCEPQWLAGPWSTCSSACGAGMQSRDLRCAAGERSKCRGEEPPSVQLCRNTTGCEWQLGVWSECSHSCGSGDQAREVWCPTLQDADCSKPQPLTTNACYSTFGCAWLAGAWSNCSSTCGAGVQTRPLGCPSGAPEDCPQDRPASSRACYKTIGCSWILSDWRGCSNQCGSGTRSRSVQCFSGVGSDCAGTAPVTSETCQSTADCAWTVSSWSPCSSSCGDGFRSRDVRCPSGLGTDCPSPKPVLSEVCRNVTGCVWQTSQWSVCNASCGDGQMVRAVTCSSGSSSDCAVTAHAPSERQDCRDTTGCGWRLGNWSTCNTTCGAGVQTRDGVCENVDGLECASPGPNTRQSCYAVSTCTWQWQEWSTCSSSCGEGLRTRSGRCSSGQNSDCQGTRPMESETCYSTSSCTWRASVWGLCSSTCGYGLRSRTVECSSGSAADCSGAALATSAECYETVGCSWAIEDWSECSASCGDGVKTRRVACSGLTDQDCAAEKPSGETTCSETFGCAWQVGSWGLCSTTCGEGTQVRNVTCPTGSTGDCPVSVPPAEQACYSVSGCAWVPSTWSTCSQECGIGIRARALACSSGREADCTHAERLPEQESCVGLDCLWKAAAWGSCSAGPCEGPGTRVREVTCPALNGELGCARYQRPTAVEACATAGNDCAWRITDWYECTNQCGWGERFRNVSCTGRHNGECVSPMPWYKEPCYNMDACTWKVTAWSTCSNSCGRGKLTRSVTCGTNCTGAKPIGFRDCQDLSSCAWNATEWGPCSSACGTGVQNRTISCSSGDDRDCDPLQKLVDGQECRGVAGCVWTASLWSSCSTSCGEGLAKRMVLCSGGRDGDCLAGARPASTTTCNESLGCFWRVGDWSSCSEVCGTGIQTRDVQCKSRNASECGSVMPASSRSCEEAAGCGWSVREWSPCTATCGDGLQHRIASCAAAGGCSGSGPATRQACRRYDGCTWAVGAWSNCTTGCGEGMRMRSVTCSGGDSLLCLDDQPAASVHCISDVDCDWRESAWSACAEDCVPQERIISCSAAPGHECPVQLSSAPLAVKLCDYPVCNSSAGRFSFQARLDVQGLNMSDGEVMERLRSSFELALADTLQVPLSSLSVTVVLTGAAEARRLSSTGLLLSVVVEQANVGALRMLQSSAGRPLLAKRLVGFIAASGEVADFTVQLSLVDEPSVDVGTSALVMEPSDASGPTTTIVVFVAPVIFLACCGACILRVFVAWRQRKLYTSQVAPERGSRDREKARDVDAPQGIEFQIGGLIHRVKIVGTREKLEEPHSPSGMTHQVEYDNGLKEWVKLDETTHCLSDDCGHVNIRYRPEGVDRAPSPSSPSFSRGLSARSLLRRAALSQDSPTPSLNDETPQIVSFAELAGEQEGIPPLDGPRFTSSSSSPASFVSVGLRPMQSPSGRTSRSHVAGVPADNP